MNTETKQYRYVLLSSNDVTKIIFRLELYIMQFRSNEKYVITIRYSGKICTKRLHYFILYRKYIIKPIGYG